MVFDQETLGEIGKELVEKGANKPCSVCGSNDLVIVDEMLLLRKSSGGDFPIIVTGCGNCGKSDFFAANTLVPGILPSKKTGHY